MAANSADDNKLWISSNEGMICLDTKTLNIKRYDASDALAVAVRAGPVAPQPESAGRLVRRLAVAGVDLFAVAVTAVTTPRAMSPRPPRSCDANTKISSFARMPLPPYMVFCARNKNCRASGSAIAALMRYDIR